MNGAAAGSQFWETGRRSLIVSGLAPAIDHRKMEPAPLTWIKVDGPILRDAERMQTTAEPREPAQPVRPCKSGKNSLAGERLAREWQTMVTMMQIYCRDYHHPGGDLCAECQQFLAYARARLERCRFGEDKPTCAKCPVHCYQRDRREQVRVMMRYAGPRMLWEHPLMSLRHWLDGWREPRHAS